MFTNYLSIQAQKSSKNIINFGNKKSVGVFPEYEGHSAVGVVCSICSRSMYKSRILLQYKFSGGDIFYLVDALIIRLTSRKNILEVNFT